MMPAWFVADPWMAVFPPSKVVREEHFVDVSVSVRINGKDRKNLSGRIRLVVAYIAQNVTAFLGRLCFVRCEVDDGP
jgi:hypothetical protein